MSEAGCLKDGIFQNISVENRLTIQKFGNPSTGILNKNLPGPYDTDYYTYFNDFTTETDITTDNFTFTSTAVNGSTVSITADDGVVGGIATFLSSNVENDGIQLQLKNETFRYSSTKDLYFETRLSVLDADQTDVVIGLCVTDTTLIVGMTDGIYFNVADGNASINFVLEKDTTATTLDTETDFVDGTVSTNYKKLAFWIPAGQNKAYVYVDDKLVKTQTTLTNIPDDENLTVSIAMLTGDASQNSIFVDYVYVTQKR